MTWQTWIMTLTWAISKTAVIIVMCEPLTLKFKKRHIILAYAAISAFFYLIRAYSAIHITSVSTELVFFLIMPVYSYIFFRISCRNKTTEIAFFMVLIYALGVLGNALAFVVYYLIFSEYLMFSFVTNAAVYGATISMLLEILFYLLFFILWKKFVGKLRSTIPNVGAFIVILGGQLIYTLYQLLDMLTKQVEVNPWTAFGIIIMTIGNLAIIQILLTNTKKAELEESLREVQHIRELEQMHYSSIEARRQEMALIRHDINNQIAAAHQLIDLDKKEHAEELLNELKQSLANTTEYTYCQNAIVNAVLTEKQKECAAMEIKLDTEIIISEKCNVTPIHLCSIFTNILDNAIRACKSLAKEQRVIELRTAVKGAYLHIKCINPVADNKDKERHGKGYGKTILTDIADHYNGKFSAEKVDNTYVVLMAVLYMAQ